jgi:hypothetical protein
LDLLGAGVWDYKAAIRALSLLTTGNADMQQVNSHFYDYDIWTNLHFGYVGSAAGFTADQLLQGAGVAQMLSDEYHTGLITQHPPAIGFASYDNPHDQAAINVGISLWWHFALWVQPSDIVNAIEAAHLYNP